MYKLLKTLFNARPTTHPRIIAAVNTHFEGIKPFMDQASLDVVELIAQS